MPVEGDDGLGRGESHHVDRTAESEQGQRASVEAPVVHEVENRWSDEEGSTGTDRSDADDDDEQSTKAVTELGQVVLSGKAREPWQQSGLHGLEQEEWNAREENSVAEARHPLGFVGPGQDVDGDRTGVHETSTHQGTHEEPSEIRGDFAPGRIGSDVGRQSAARPHVHDSGQGRQSDEQREGSDVVDSHLPQDDGSDHAHESVGPHHDAVRRETRLTRADSAGEMGRCVGHESDDERRSDESVPLEEFAGGEGTESGHDRHHDGGDGDAEWNDARHDRTTADAEGAPVGERSTHFLFEWQEEPGCHDEGGEPQGDDGLEVVLAQGFLADLEEQITREPGDDEADADGHGAFGKWGAGLRVGSGHRGVALMRGDPGGGCGRMGPATFQVGVPTLAMTGVPIGGAT